MFAPAFCLVWVVKRQWDVGRPAPRPPLRLAAMRSLTVCRCRGRRPRRPAEVSCGGRYAGGMNFSPTGYLLAGVGRKVAEGSRPLPTMQWIKGWQWRGSGPGMPGPYRVVWVGFVMDVGRPAPRPPLRLAAMRSLTGRRCRGRRPRRPAEVSGGGRYAGGMNFSPYGLPVSGSWPEGGGGVKTPPYDAKNKVVAMAR